MYLFGRSSSTTTPTKSPGRKLGLSSLSNSLLASSGIGPPPLFSEDNNNGSNSNALNNPTSEAATTATTAGRTVPILKVAASPEASFRPVSSFEDEVAPSETPVQSPAGHKLSSSSPGEESIATATTAATSTGTISPSSYSYLSAATTSPSSFKASSGFLSPASKSYLFNSPMSAKSKSFVPKTPTSKKTPSAKTTTPRNQRIKEGRRSGSNHIQAFGSPRPPSTQVIAALPLYSNDYEDEEEHYYDDEEVPTTPTTTSPLKKKKLFRSSPSPFSKPANKQRIKTEMCIHYEKTGQCPFGARCTYAHGTEELQQKKLLAMHRMGLVEDVETFRTKPCMLWVSTGSCPFAKRCCGIHDQRVKGSVSTWLPVTETQGNALHTDINVDGLYQKRQQAIHQNNPFGNQFSFEKMKHEDSCWMDLYNLVCNTPPTDLDSSLRHKSSKAFIPLTQAHKIAIALKMRGGSSWTYKYKPTHLIYGSECMVLQTRAFKTFDTDSILEIPVYECDSRKASQFIVREIAFGPDSDPNVRGVSLFFDVEKNAIAANSFSKARAFRLKSPGSPTNDNDGIDAVSMDPSCDSSPKKQTPAQSWDRKAIIEKLLDQQESFAMIRPYDHDAYELVTDILKHRLQMSKAENKSVHASIEKLTEEKLALEQRFLNLRRHWMAWAWPTNMGRQCVDESTPVPLVDCNYVPILSQSPVSGKGNGTSGDESSSMMGILAKKIWDSFVNAELEPPPQCRPMICQPVTPQQLEAKKRLCTFEKLAKGEPIASNRSLPHIRREYFTPTQVDQAQQIVSATCWMAVLYPQRFDEWSTIRTYFAQKDSSRVLHNMQL